MERTPELIRTGLVSITFRQESPERVVALASEAQLAGIEWGGDIHVPHGQLDTAKRVGQMTRDVGLKVAAYGSYYRADESEAAGLSFSSVLDTAQALGAPTIRIWAGSKATALADDADWSRVVKDAQRIADMAKQAGIRVCLEYHGNTLTDHHEAAITLHQRIGRDNVDLLWQPLHNHPFDVQLQAAKTMLPRVSNVHVFWWLPFDSPCGFDRKPLSQGAEPWQSFIGVLNQSDQDRYALLEFVKGDCPDQFRQDARTLKALLNE